jgi:hypothetical protein
MSDHARDQMNGRNIQLGAVEAALEYGRVATRPGNAVVYAIGRKEIAEARAEGIDISKYNGVQVVVTTQPGRAPEVITVYRNRNLQSIKGRRSYKRD